MTESDAVDLGAFRRYLLGAFLYALLYYALNRILWRGHRSPADAALVALLWGLIMQALFVRGERLKREGKERYPPIFYIGCGVLGLGLCAGCWFSATPRLTGAEEFGLLAGVAVSLWLLACGYLVARRRSMQSVGR